MMITETINEDNYEAIAIKNYNNPQCTGIDEFQEDMNERPKWIKRLLRKYDNGGELRERLILNHIIIFCNVFGPDVGTRLLFYKLENSLHSYLKTFIIYLEYYNPTLRLNDKSGEIIDFERISLDDFIVKRLREIK